MKSFTSRANKHEVQVEEAESLPALARLHTGLRGAVCVWSASWQSLPTLCGTEQRYDSL